MTLFGASVAALGDLNGDGITELAVGAPRNNADGPAVYLLALEGVPSPIACPLVPIQPGASACACDGGNIGKRQTWYASSQAVVVQLTQPTEPPRDAPTTVGGFFGFTPLSDGAPQRSASACPFDSAHTLGFDRSPLRL